MFISNPSDEFPIPDGLDHPGNRHWRSVELTLHAPWFILSVEQDQGVDEVRFVHTILVAFEQDLLKLIELHGAQAIRAVVCMLPGWMTGEHTWTSREVSEVWSNELANGYSFVELCDFDGALFDAGVRHAGRVDIVQRQLALKCERPPQDHSCQGRC